MKGYKGFNSQLQCTPGDKVFQYETGKEYETDGAKCCEEGFHFCENPFDVFNYYAPCDSRYCEVEGDGIVDKFDDKVAVSKIKIGVEIGLKGLIEAGVKFILGKVNWKDAKESNTGDQSAATNTGDQSAATNTGIQSVATNTGDQSVATNTGNWSAATNTGNQSAATNTGYRSAATNTGNRSAATVDGEESVAVSLGRKGKAKGALGCWLVLAEWAFEDSWHRKDVRCVKVDGETIKADMFYTLKDGRFAEVEEHEANCK